MTAGRKRAPAPTRVMLVDDHPLWRSTIRKVLEHRRFANVVGEAEDGTAALSVATKTSPDVVVMDIDLPGKNGIEATRELTSSLPDLRVLVLAASNDRGQVLRAVEAGASGYLLKSASSDEVKQAVQRVRAGELVFPPSLASMVLTELRRMNNGKSPSSLEQTSSVRFEKEGDYWTIEYRGDVFRLKDARGVRYLAQLLYNPRQEFPATDLVVADKGGRGLVDQGAGPILDPQAKSTFKRRLSDLQEEIDEAAEWGDYEREERAREEYDAIVAQLGAAVGLGGRDRRASSASERARVNATVAIRSVLSRIAEHSPALGQHLNATVKTGTFCSYEPDPRAPITWAH